MAKGDAIIDRILRDLLKDNVKIEGDLGATIEQRLQDKILLLDNPASRGGAAEKARLKAKHSRANRSSIHFSSRQHRKLGSFHLPEQYLQYALYKPLQDMWTEYAASLLTGCSDSLELIQSSLLSADLHGATLAVVESNNGSVVGTQGIVVQETEHTFSILTSIDKLHVVPKRGAIFSLQIEDLRVILVGNNLSLRSLRKSAVPNPKPASIEL